MRAPVFISYSSKDQRVAETVCSALESRGYRCWIAVRDVVPGEDFQESIVAAIENAEAMVLVFTENAHNSAEIKKELVLAGQHELVVIPARVEDIRPRGAFAYQLATRQWVDLFDDWERGIQRLAARVAAIVGPAAERPAAPQAVERSGAEQPGPQPQASAPPVPDPPTAAAPGPAPARVASRLPEAGDSSPSSAAAPVRRRRPWLLAVLWPRSWIIRAALILLVAGGSAVAYWGYWELLFRIESRVMAVLNPPLKTLAFQGLIQSAALAPDGKSLSVVTWHDPKDNFEILDLETGKVIRTLGGATRFRSVSYSPDGKWIAAGSSEEKTVLIWEAESGKLVRTLRGHAGSVNAVAFSPDGRRLASGSDDLTIRIWDFATGQTIRTLTGHTRAVAGVAFAPDGRRLASGASEPRVWLWDTATGQALRSWPMQAVAISSFAFSPDSKTLISGGYDQFEIVAWDTDGGRPSFERKNVRVESVAYSPGGTWIALGGLDTVHVWRSYGREIKNYYGHAGLVDWVGFSPDAKRIISAGRDGVIRIWNTPDP